MTNATSRRPPPASRARWGFVAVSFGAMVLISAWFVWSGRNGHAPLVIPPMAHAAALSLVLLEIVSRAVKLHWGAAAVSVPLSFSVALRTCLGGDFAAAMTPARSGAEPARFLVLAEARLPTQNIVVVLFLELLMELATILVVALGLWLAFRGSAAELSLIAGVVVGYAIFVLGLGMVGLTLSRRRAAGPPPSWAGSLGLHAGHWRRVQRALRQLRGSIGALRSAKPQMLIAASVASLVHVLAKLAVLPAIVLGMDRLTDLAPLMLWPLILLYGGAVAPAPGGGGAVEFGFQQAFSGVLTPSALATALIWWRIYTLYLYMLFGAFAGGTTVVRALRPARTPAAS